MSQSLLKLVPPHADKHWSVQGYRIDEETRRKIIAAMHSEAVMPARPFLQGDSGGWIMVEFWTGDKEVIDAAADHLAKAVKLPLGEGDFTREELRGD